MSDPVDKNDTELIPQPPGDELGLSAPEPGDGGVLAQLTAAAVAGLDVDKLERLIALQERVMDRNAASEFHAALAQFQAECPPIQRTSTARIASKHGAAYSYTYAELDEIARTIQKPLHSTGLSYSWDSTIEGGNMKVVCTLSHSNGHSREAQFVCPVDGSPSMSAAQKHAATLTFAKRQALVSVLGLTTSDPDPDAPQAIDLVPVTEDQATELEMLCADVGADPEKFKCWLGVEKFAAIRACDYQRAREALKRKGKAQSGAPK